MDWGGWLAISLSLRAPHVSWCAERKKNGVCSGTVFFVFGTVRFNFGYGVLYVRWMKSCCGQKNKIDEISCVVGPHFFVLCNY